MQSRNHMHTQGSDYPRARRTHSVTQHDTGAPPTHKVGRTFRVASIGGITGDYTARSANRPTVASYLASTRNAHLPETVRRWLAEGEGFEQDQVESIEVGDWQERSSIDTNAPPHCSCCVSALPEGHYPVRVRLAESETCHAFDETIEVGPECVGDWREAEARV